MGAIAFTLLGLGLIGGGTMLLSSSTVKTIKFPSVFYKDLMYFKMDKNKVIAIKRELSEEIIYSGSIASTEKYFNKVQLGFEEWLKDNDHFSKSESKVKFS